MHPPEDDDLHRTRPQHYEETFYSVAAARCAGQGQSTFFIRSHGW